MNSASSCSMLWKKLTIVQIYFKLIISLAKANSKFTGVFRLKQVPHVQWAIPQTGNEDSLFTIIHSPKGVLLFTLK